MQHRMPGERVKSRLPPSRARLTAASNPLQHVQRRVHNLHATRPQVLQLLRAECTVRPCRLVVCGGERVRLFVCGLSTIRTGSGEPGSLTWST